MDKFEYIYYKFADESYTYADGSDNKKWVKASLVELGQKGWEIAMPDTKIVQLNSSAASQTSGCYLKRKIEEPSPSVDLQAISDESYKILTKAAYTGMLMAYDMLEKMGRLPHQQLKQQSPTTKKQDVDHSYDRR